MEETSRDSDMASSAYSEAANVTGVTSAMIFFCIEIPIVNKLTNFFDQKYKRNPTMYGVRSKLLLGRPNSLL